MKNKKFIKLLVLGLILLVVFCIYTFFKTDKINYIVLGDSLAEGMNPYKEIGYSYADFLKEELEDNNKLSYYTKKYTKSGYTTEDLTKEININPNLKKDLRESNLVTVSIGANDIIKSINLKNININNILDLKTKVESVLPNLEDCIKNIRKYAKEEVIIIGYYNPIPFLFNMSGNDIDELFAYVDDEYKKIADKYECSYISIYELFKENTHFLPNPTDIHPNLDGYEAISDEIIKKMKLYTWIYKKNLL